MKGQVTVEQAVVRATGRCSILVFVWMCVLGAGVSLTGQVDRVLPRAWPQIVADANAAAGDTVENQRNMRARQAELQAWFVARIQSYQQILDDTYLGRANPRIVFLGDFNRPIQRLLAEPRGRGQYAVVFDNANTARVPEYDTLIEFPQANRNAYLDDYGRFNTCWHEFQHVILLNDAARVLIRKVSPWQRWMKMGNDTDPHHVYFEALAEHMVEWLDGLLHETTTLSGGRGAGRGFETLIREAGALAREYERRGENITYCTEHAIWGKAHDAWILCWSDADKIAPLPLNLRENYRQVTGGADGVWMGFVEDIIRFYMNGGVTADDGTPIRVPEWVMIAQPMQSSVIVGHLNEKKDITAETLRYGFDVRVMETYRQRERSRSLNHGKAIITLENADPDSFIEVTTASGPIKPSLPDKSSFVVDLTRFAWDDSIRITFVRSNLNKLIGKKQYQVAVHYQDDTPTVGGKTRYSFYYQSKAKYFIDVTGTGKTGAASTPPVTPPSTGSSVTAGGPPSTGTSSKGRWIFRQKWESKSPTPGNASVRYTVNFSESNASIIRSVIYPKAEFYAYKLSWTAPLPNVLIPGTVNNWEVVIDDGGSVNAVNPRMRIILSAGTTMRRPGGRPGALSAGLNAELKFSDRTVVRTSDSGKWTVPTGEPGDTLRYGVRVDGWCSYEVTWEYVWEVEASGPSGPARPDAVLSAEEEKPEPDDPGLDNVPPDPGDVVKIIKSEDDRRVPTPDGPKVESLLRWYIHASKNYRFRLLDKWEIAPKTFFDEKNDGYDTLWPEDKEMAIICSRDVIENGGKSEEAVLNESVVRLLKDNPTGKVTRLSLGPSPDLKVKAVQVAVYDANDRVMTWHLVLVHSPRSYYIAVSRPTPAFEPDLPGPVAQMLGSVEFMSDKRK